MPRHSTAQHRNSTAQHSTAQHSTAQHSTAQHSTAQHSTAQHSTAQHSTAQHSTAQHSTAQHSTAQHSTAQHSTAQHSTAQHNARPAVYVAGRWAVILGKGHNPGALVTSLAYNAELCIFNLLQLLEVFSQSRIQDGPFPPQIVEADSLYFSACSHTSTSTSAGEQHQTVYICHQVILPPSGFAMKHT